MAAKPEQVFTRIESVESCKDFESSAVGGVRGSKPLTTQGNYAAQIGSEPRRVLVFGKQAHRMLCLEFPRSDSPDMDMMDPPLQAELQIPSQFANRKI